jgi:hypothetical protein
MATIKAGNAKAVKSSADTNALLLTESRKTTKSTSLNLRKRGYQVVDPFEALSSNKENIVNQR